MRTCIGALGVGDPGTAGPRALGHGAAAHARDGARIRLFRDSRGFGIAIAGNGASTDAGTDIADAAALIVGAPGGVCPRIRESSAGTSTSTARAAAVRGAQMSLELEDGAKSHTASGAPEVLGKGRHHCFRSRVPRGSLIHVHRREGSRFAHNK